MAIKFISDNTINTELTRLIKDADQYLFLISPYIKLHDRLKRDLLTKIEYYDLLIIVVFGKNEDGLSKSLSKDDFEFLAQFPNIEIKYESKLHAKYYASEDRAMITSMNLHEYSQNNNIEAAILMDVKSTLASLTSDDPELDALNYFEEVIKNAKPMFDKQANIKKGLLGLTSEYLGSDILIDEMTAIYGQNKSNHIGFKTFQSNTSPLTAYCIRTGVQIPFDINKPYSDYAFRSWQNFGNENYKEKFCHFSGEESNGETCLKSPILKKNWRAAKSKFGF